MVSSNIFILLLIYLALTLQLEPASWKNWPNTSALALSETAVVADLIVRTFVFLFAPFILFILFQNFFVGVSRDTD